MVPGLDIWLNKEYYESRVVEALESLHWEKGLWRSFTVSEIAKEAALPASSVKVILEGLRRRGLVGRRRGGRYYLKNLADTLLSIRPSQLEL